MLFTEMYFKYNIIKIKRIQNNRMEKYVLCRYKQKRASSAKLISDKVDFR